MARTDLLQRLNAQLVAREQAQLRRRLHTVDRIDGVYLQRDGRRLLNFCSNDYLALAQHPKLRSALERTVAKAGVGSASAHLICGHHREHARLEENLAAWTGRECALLFSSGYMANMGVLQALLQPSDLCLQDKLNHACLLDGARLAGAQLKRYRHVDVASAARQLASRPDAAAVLVTDAVFSMDGDVAPLAALARLCTSTQVTLMVDDAHGLGVLGQRGAGSVSMAGLSQYDVPVLTATLGKALGCSGAFVAGSRGLIEGVLQGARPYIYTTALPPAMATAASTAVDIAQHENWRREKLTMLIDRFRCGAKELGLPLLSSDSAIQPVLLGDAQAVLKAAQLLEQRDLLVAAIRPPTVPLGQARLRISLSAAHDPAHIDCLLEALTDVLAALFKPDSV